MINEAYKIIFSPKAYVQICTEVQDYPRLETGGILIGQRYGNTFYVFESTDSGVNGKHTPTEFHRDYEYTGRLAYKKVNIYNSATVVGYWHRHPGSMNVFSGGDNESNIEFAQKFNGVISGLINIYPRFVPTFYYIHPNGKTELIRDLRVSEIPLNIIGLKDFNSVIAEVEATEASYGTKMGRIQDIQVYPSSSSLPKMQFRKNIDVHRSGPFVDIVQEQPVMPNRTQQFDVSQKSQPQHLPPVKKRRDAGTQEKTFDELANEQRVGVRGFFAVIANEIALLEERGYTTEVKILQPNPKEKSVIEQFSIMVICNETGDSDQLIFKHFFNKDGFYLYDPKRWLFCQHKRYKSAKKGKPGLIFKIMFTQPIFIQSDE